MAASLASLPSMVIVSGSPLRRMAFFRNRSAASLSRYSVRRKSIVWPCLSTARYRYRHWPVGRIRARYLTARLPNPPVRPVRETFASYGSREREIMRRVHFASSTVHSPWTALRVRWVPVYCFPTRSLRPFAMCAVFPHSDYYGLFDCLEGFGVSLGSRLPTLHPPSHPFQALPCSQHRTQSRML